MRLAKKNLSVVAGFAFAIVALAACGSGDTADSGGSIEASEPPVAPAVVLPVVGECWDYPKMDGWSLDGAPVDCASKHTAQTVWVGELPATVVERPFTVLDEFKKKYTQADGIVDYTDMTDVETEESRAINKLLQVPFKSCRVAMNSSIGADLPDGVTMRSRFTADITGPDIEEWAAGARWLRCNASAKTPTDSGVESVGLMTLPEDIRGVMRAPEGIKFNYCYAFGDDGVANGSVCGTPEAKDAWLSISIRIPQPKNMVWAGKKAAQKKTSEVCEAFVRDYVKILPTSAWAAGWYENPDGKQKDGYTKNTWGTDKATFGCGVKQENYKQPNP